MPRSSIERESVPLESLPKEQQTDIESLETHTDELYGLRSQLVTFYRQYGEYIPQKDVQRTETVVKSVTTNRDVTLPAIKKQRVRLGELSQAVLNGASLDELIPWDTVDAAFESQSIPEQEKELARAVHRDDVRAAFEVAIENYNDLKNKGGEWRKRDLTEAEQDLRDYYRLRWGTLGESIRQFSETEHQIKIVESKLEYQRNQLQQRGARPAALRVLDQYEKEYASLFKRGDEIAHQSPEAYLYIHGRQLREAKDLFDAQGRIVETPYVKTKMAHIQEILEQGRPVFIHGELGTGKSELAKHVARKELSKLHVTRWEAANPAPDDPGARQAWEARRSEEAEALVISGHRGLEADQIIAARGIERGVVPIPEEQVERIRHGWLGYRDTILQQARKQGQTAESIVGLETKLDTIDREIYEKAMLESFRNSVETKAILGPLLRAAKEGRPVIIDEMNAIPHHVLIVLNDILMRRPGEMIDPPVPEAQPFQVQKGFVVIATGNYKPEDGKMYIGRQPFDAAFLSRYGIVSYDYLPMERMREPLDASSEAKRELRRTNELYHMLMARLLNTDLSLTVPEGSLSKLKEVARVARLLQDIFSNPDANFEFDTGKAKVKSQDVLKENVLSIRHLLPIIDRWRSEGFQRDIDDYLFLDYVARSDARPKEKEFIYQFLKIQGDFFPDAKGWPGVREKDKIMSYPIDQKMYAASRETGLRTPLADRSLPLKTYSPKQIIEELYGPAPTRKNIPKTFVERNQTLAPTEKTEDALEEQRWKESIQAKVGIIKQYLQEKEKAPKGRKKK